MHFTTKKDYMKEFQTTLAQEGEEREALKAYLDKQSQKLDQLTAAISQETFWQIFPEILGIDAKLNILTELIPYDDFTNDEIIRIIESDYQNYFKELSGYDLKMKTKPSLIFNVV